MVGEKGEQNEAERTGEVFERERVMYVCMCGTESARQDEKREEQEEGKRRGRGGEGREELTALMAWLLTAKNVKRDPLSSSFFFMFMALFFIALS